MKQSNKVTELEMRIAVALSMTTGSFGPLGGAVRRLNSIHDSLKSQRAAGLLTEAEYAKEARGLLNLLNDLDGLQAEAANRTSHR